MIASDIGADRRRVPQRLMYYCHDSMGIGHLRRGIAICDHLTHEFPQSSLLLATGTPYVPLFKLPPGVDYIKLPALMKEADGSYHSKYLSLRVRQLLRCRRAIMLAAVQSFQPSVFLVDKTPVGVCKEIVPILRWIQRNCPGMRVVFGMRDIEDAPDATIAQWNRDGVPEILDECFDEIWVYGSERVYDVVRSYRLSSRLNEKLRYTGYIDRGQCVHPQAARDDRKQVLVTVGGGSDGESLLLTYLAGAARRVADGGGSSTIVGGPDMPHSVARGVSEAVASLPGTTWIDHTSCMSCLMRGADVVVSMGGYNTMCEIVSSEKAGLVVPRTSPRLEQEIRATRWEQLGMIRSLHPRELTPQNLGDRVLDMLVDPPIPDRGRLDLGGLGRIADRFSSLWSGDGRRETALRL